MTQEFQEVLSPFLEFINWVSSHEWPGILLIAHCQAQSHEFPWDRWAHSQMFVSSSDLMKITKTVPTQTTMGREQRTQVSCFWRCGCYQPHCFQDVADVTQQQMSTQRESDRKKGAQFSQTKTRKPKAASTPWKWILLRHHFHCNSVKGIRCNWGNITQPIPMISTNQTHHGECTLVLASLQIGKIKKPGYSYPNNLPHLISACISIVESWLSILLEADFCETVAEIGPLWSNCCPVVLAPGLQYHHLFFLSFWPYKWWILRCFLLLLISGLPISFGFSVLPSPVKPIQSVVNP